MQILIHARDYTITPAMKSFIERKLGFGVGRFDDRIARINVRLKDMNGPRGGVDQYCRVDLAMNTGDIVAAEATALDIYTAIKDAVARVARRVRRTIDRKRAARNRAALYPPHTERYDAVDGRAYQPVEWDGGAP